MPVRRSARSLLLALALFFAFAGVAPAGLPVYVADGGATPAVRVVDSATGATQQLTSGGHLAAPTGIAIEADGDLVISDGVAGVIRVDRATGVQTLVQGAGFGTLDGIAVRPDGTLLVTDSNRGGLLGLLFTTAAVLRVDPASGATSTLTIDGRFEDPAGLAIAASGDVYVADPNGPSASGSLVKVNGTDGTQVNAAQGGGFSDPTGVALEDGGTMLVADPRGASSGAVWRVSAGTPAALVTGGPLVDPRAIALEATGSALVADPGAGMLLRVTPVGAVSDVGAGVNSPVAVAIPADDDADGVAQLDDNCPAVANGAQTDTDADGAGNACDADDDGDGVSDAIEGTRGTNPLVKDSDGDGAWDGADTCALVANADQLDTDGDAVGDACDADDDGDGLLDIDEPARGTDPLRPDTDGDGTDDRLDNCPVRFNAGQPDADGDGVGNACDATPHGEEAVKEKPKDAAPAAAFDPRLAAPVAPEPVPQPVLGKAVGVAAKDGRVTVRRPGSAVDVPLVDGQVPLGAVVDTSAGAITLTSALPDGSVQSARFTGGRFTVTQRRDGITDLRLAGPPPACASSRRLRLGSITAYGAATAERRRPRRGARLWGDGHGRFRTHGRNAVAAVRGTRWLVEETCGGTLVRVTRGVVSVRDKRQARTRLVRAGERYLARRPK